MSFHNKSARTCLLGAASVFAFAAAGAFSAPAMAQETATKGSLDLIIVTAQKRKENVQDVPISISTMDEDTLHSILSGTEDILALATRIPSLYAESSNGRVAPRFYIRGLGNTDFDLAASQPVSVIMDDVVMENVALKSFPLFDVKQVEVLRGPQGTLFGRNTPAGIVKFDTNRPTQDFEVGGTLTYARYNTVKAEGAMGGGLVEDKLAVRIAGLVEHRANWVNNGFTGEKNVLGGFDEAAARIQFLFTPNERLSALFSAQGRSISGNSATLFRANIIGPGNSKLNNNFKRGTVFFDGGDNNFQEYQGGGLTANIAYEADGATFTSITSLQTVEGSSIGDIDGGNGAVFLPGGGGPGFIKFPSVTEGSIKDHNQFTQEFRLASNTSGPATWQVGAYYFNSDLTLGTNPFFVPETVLKQSNNSWAVFGQTSYDITEQLTITGGIRYTEDSKTLTPIAVNLPTPVVKVSDNKVSWDLSANYAATDDVNLYVRAARGFRGPSIQGRDVAFFGTPSVAQSETINSYETGFKSELIENTLRLNADVYYYRIKNMQLTAIGGGGNFNRLINAKKGVGKGFETDLEWLPTESLMITGGFSYNDTELKDKTLKTVPCGSGICTVLDPLDGLGNALLDGNPFPQAPKTTGNFTARYSMPAGQDGEFYVFTDWSIQGKTNFFLYKSAEFRSSGNFEGGLRLGYARNDGKYDIAVFVRNITDEKNLKGGIDFNNNTGFVNEPRIFGISLSVHR